MSSAVPDEWRFFKFGLFVTGKGEKKSLPKLFRSLIAAAPGQCTFEVVEWLGQRSAITSPKRQIEMVGSGKKIPDRDEERIGLPARKWLDRGCAFIVLVDDLEHARAEERADVFQRYRAALDVMLRDRKGRASVHFLVNMLEAYYFAHAAALNAVLGTALTDYEGDVETIRHPKNDLKSIHPGFDEVRHGDEILGALDVDHILCNAETCASLRALFAWCWRAMGKEPTDRFKLDAGIHDVVTGRQMGEL